MRSCLFLILPLALVSACETNSTKAVRVDDTMLAYVDESGREEIAEARLDAERVRHDIAMLKGEISRRQNDLQLVKEERNVVRAELDAAKLRVDSAAAQSEADARAAEENLAGVHAEMRRVEAEIARHEGLVTEAEMHLAVAEARENLMEERVELTKAEALRRTDSPEARKIDVEQLRSAVDRAEQNVEMARVDAEAAERKVAILGERLDLRVKEVPEGYRHGVIRDDAASLRPASADQEAERRD